MELKNIDKSIVSDVKQRVYDEYDTIYKWYEGLTKFIGTEAFNKLSVGNRLLLLQQEKAQKELIDILAIRLENKNFN